MGDQVRCPQDTAAVLPDQCVQGLRRGIAGRAALALGQPQCIGAASTAVILVARVEGAAAAREPTLATTDEPTQSVCIGRISAAGHLPVAIQTAVGRFKELLTNEGWHRHGDPLFRGRGLLTLARAHWLEGGFTPARWRGAGAATIGHPCIGGRPQDAANRGDIPTLAAPGWWYLGIAEAFGHGISAH
jgi:hypothetical protein